MDPVGTTTPDSTDSNYQSLHNVYLDENRASSLLQGFALLYQNSQFTDIVLLVDNREFPCHKNVLAASSPYFMGMFSSDMSESQQKTVILNDISAETMELVLTHIYTAEVMLTEDTVQNLLSAANLFQLISLRNGCAEFMMKHVTVANCIGIYFFACAHECDLLAIKAKEIINNQISLLCREQEFLMLPVNKLVEILTDDQLNVTEEEVVYEACLGWLYYELDNRKKDIYEVMSCVRFATISSYYFCDNIDSNPLFDDCKDLKDILKNVRYYLLLKNRQHEMDLNFMPRKGMPYRRCVLVLANPYCEDNTCNKKLSSVEELNLNDSLITHVSHLPKNLYMPGCAVTGNNHIYVAGGAIRKTNYRGSMIIEEISDTLLVFDSTSKSWQIKAHLNHRRYQFSLTVLDGFIYAIGGHDEERSYLSSVERYDIHRNTWLEVSHLPVGLRCMAAISYKGKLYIFGGETSAKIVNVAFRYDPTENDWTALPSMTVPKALVGAVVYQDKIFIVGGNTVVSEKWKHDFLPEHCTSQVEIFDPLTSSWTEGPNLPTALCGAGVVKYNNTILVVGGEDDKSWMASTFALSKDLSGEYHWLEGQELPTVMSTCGCVVANLSCVCHEDWDPR